MSYTWSFSSLKDYINCPKQYQEIKVLKRFYKAATPQMTYGNEAHKAMENYVRDGTPLAKNYSQYQPVLDVLVEKSGVKYPEHKMALDKDGNACEYNSGYWVRGIVDLMILDGDTAFIVDYKTGSNKYADTKQLKLMALMVFAHFPQVQKIKAGLLFVAYNSFIDESYEREDIKELWANFYPDLMRLNNSYENNVWNPNPTPLCGWCPVKTCDFYKEKR
jgi:hypothetical protein